MVDVRKVSREVTVTPTITVGNYTASTTLGNVKELDVSQRGGNTVTLDCIKFLDKARQSAEMQLFFFTEDPSSGVSGDKTEFNINDTTMEKCAGVVNIFSCDYAQSKSNSFSNIRNIGLDMLSASGNFWVVAKVLENAAYTAVNNLVFTYDFTFNYSGGGGE